MAALAADGGALKLGLPVDCDMARDCSIQKYVDRAAGPQRLDYHCGALTTDGHGGTDFRLRRSIDFGRGTRVVAAAAGTVLRVRDGMPDISARDPAAPPIGQHLAGNAVVLDHGDGWETQYSHLKRGSVRVRPGDRVEVGSPLGVIGMSGFAEFPHVHFEVRHDGKTVDPFAAASLEGCGKAASALWSKAALAALPYRETEVLAIGFATSMPQARLADQQIAEPGALADPDALILWASVSGVQSEDVGKFRIIAPNGGVLLARETRITSRSLHLVGFAGLRRPPGGWVPGVYRGAYWLTRGGKILGESHIHQTISSQASP